MLLSLEENDLRSVGALQNSLEVHSVMHSVLGLYCFLEKEVVMPLLQSVKSNVFVVTPERLKNENYLSKWRREGVSPISRINNNE